jgi:hypothetical protein
MTVVGTQSQIGWRALLTLACCGATAGFAVPAIVSSLVQQERRQPSVRLLRAPRLPSSETQIPLPESAIASGRRAGSIAVPRPLTRRELRELERKERRTPSILSNLGEHSRTAEIPPASAPQSSSTVPASPSKQGPPHAPAGSKQGATAGTPQPQSGGTTHSNPSGETGSTPSDTGGTSSEGTGGKGVSAR